MAKKYNLLIVTSSLYIGGAEEVIRNLSYQINRELFNVSVCYLKKRGDIGDEMKDEGVDVVGIPRSKNLKIDYISFLKLYRIIKSKKIDIVHSHTTQSLTDSSLCKLFLPRLKLIHTFHFGNYPNGNKTRILLEKVFWRMTEKMIAVGDVQKKQIQTTYKIPDDRITKIWNGISFSRETADLYIKNKIENKDEIIIGTIATLFEQKGITYLLDVASCLKKNRQKVKFLIVGDGPLRKELELKCERLGLNDAVQFAGWIKNATINILPTFDIFFQPSLWEAMPMVILEAMAAAKPIVATNVGENRHIIDSGKNGFLVEPKDINAMVAALEKLISDPKLRVAFGSEAKKKWGKQFTSNIMTKNYEQLYMRVLEMD